MKCSRRHPQVQLGIHWRRFAQPQADLRMLGTIQSGLEIGALARTADGRYLQVNGSILRELHVGRIEAAIQRYRSFVKKLQRSGLSAATQQAETEPPDEVQAEMPVVNRPPAPPPTVVYKKRRFTMTPAEAVPG